MMDDIKQGDVRDFRNFVSAVIDKKSFDKISDYLEDARRNATIVAGGKAFGDEGFYIAPTLVETDEPDYRLLCEEIFGPVVTAYVYDDAKWSETLEIRGHGRSVCQRRGDTVRVDLISPVASAEKEKVGIGSGKKYGIREHVDEGTDHRQDHRVRDSEYGQPLTDIPARRQA